MKLGAENQKKTIIAALLFIVGLGLFIRMLSGSPEPSTPVRTSTGNPARVQQAQRRQVAVRRAGTAKSFTEGPVTPSLDPRLRLSTIAETESLDYTGKGRNIFKAQMDEPAAPKIEEAQAPAFIGPAKPEPPPPPPPIPLKFFGFAAGSGNKTVFLSQNDDVFLAKEGDIVQRRYKIVKINNANIEVLDVLSNNRQTIPLTAG